jgi:hypothetical protein
LFGFCIIQILIQDVLKFKRKLRRQWVNTYVHFLNNEWREVEGAALPE